MTKGEWQAFGLVLEVLRQKRPSDVCFVWDDYSLPSWVDQMREIIEVKQDALDGNFGEHRNRSKKFVPEGEWIVMLDADEMILPGFIESLHVATEVHGGVDSIFLDRRNTFWDETGSPAFQPSPYNQLFKPDFQGRVFRNIESIRYQGHVHEGLVGYDWPVYLRGEPFTIIHHKRRVPPRYLHLVKP